MTERIFKKEFEIKEGHIIPPYNHVHHATILYYLEECRISLLEQMGFAPDNLLKDGLFPAIASMEIDYLRETKSSPVTITVENPKFKRKVMEVTQKIYNSEGKIALSATVNFVLFSIEQKRAIVPSQEFVDAFLNF